MTYKIFATVLALTVFAGCSHNHKGSRHPSSLSGLSLLPLITSDIGVVGPKGEVLLYYREGNSIIVKNCEPLTILGATPADARSKCQGKTNKVPVESFKQEIRKLVSTSGLNQLKPVTAEELNAFREAGGLSAEDMEKMQAEINKINAFITEYGKKDSPMIRLEELKKELKSNETRSRAIKKIDAEIEKTLARMTSNRKLTIVNSASLDCDDQDEKVKNQFMYTVLKNFDPKEKYPCGLSGTIEETTKECSEQESSSRGNFTLISRSKHFEEIYKDNKSGFIWSDRIHSRTNHASAVAACAGLPKIDNKSWRLPTIEEFKEADVNGIRSALPNMIYWFWSSSEDDDNTSRAWLFSGNFGDLGYDYRFSFVGSIRCVAR